MELLILVLIWIGAITQEESNHLSHNELNEIRIVHNDVIEVEYPEEYAIIMIDENEVN